MLILILLFFVPSLIQGIKQEGILYALVEGMTLGTVDLQSGNITTFGPNYGTNIGLAEELAAIDNNAKLFYTIAYNFTNDITSVFALSLDSGEIASSLIVPLAQSGFVGVGQTIQVDSTGDVLITGQTDANTTTFYLWRANLVQGTFTQITSYQSEPLLGGFACYDSDHNLLWLDVVPPGSTLVFLYAFDAANGNLVMNVTDDLETVSLNYDIVKHQLVGIGEGFNGTTTVCSIVTIDPTTGAGTVVGLMNEWEIPYLALTGLDPVSRHLFGYISKLFEGNPYLVVLDIDTATTVDAFPATMYTVPWSLEWYSPSARRIIQQ